ncbi:hypothetical protein HF086_001945 [Spodoptera exigua]|uniref:RWD domain-containing protein n=1 Tax=Spodoptera exigua TaxID=7107 RepID=A0A922MF77_SPOEX|nr:hypothetical protein HF086_001945 [Spodoptera exigua]
METDNLTKQNEEIEALGAIYGDDWIVECDKTRSYCIKITEKKYEVVLYVTMPEDYPSQSPANYELSAPWMDRQEKIALHQALDEIYLENVGECVVFQWVEKIREVLQTIKPAKREANRKKDRSKSKSPPTLQPTQAENEVPEIIHGEVIVDRKSIFQGHAAEVHSIEDVKKTNKGASILQDCDDDGEAHAGGRMLHLLQILDQKNTLVVVSRWYGGIQLGPDRFRHINNATRQAIQQAGLLKK